MRIEDPLFLRQLSRRFCGRPARYLAECDIYVINLGVALHVEITLIFTTVISLAWVRGRVYVTSDTQPGILSPTYGDAALTEFVNRFIRRHRLEDLLKKKGVA